jgi:hypothetical protein
MGQCLHFRAVLSQRNRSLTVRLSDHTTRVYTLTRDQNDGDVLTIGLLITLIWLLFAEIKSYIIIIINS